MNNIRGKLYSSVSFAKDLGITKGAINNWLRKHEEFCNNPEYIHLVPSGKKPRRFFTELGMTVYLNSKGNFHGNMNSIRSVTELKEAKKTEGKEKIAVAAFKSVTNYNLLPEKYANDQIIMLRVAQIEAENKISELEEKIIHTEEKLETIARSIGDPTMKITNQSREMLNEFVRRLAKFTFREYREIWNGMHLYVGRRSIENYTQADYYKAYKWIRSEYEAYGIDF